MGKSDHFKNKEAISHVAEVQAKGIIDSNEPHGVETPGVIAAGCDAAKETAVMLLLLSAILLYYPVPFSTTLGFYLIFSLSLIIWKAGRSAWLGWSRLERLHRVLEEERWEITHNRPQEKEELAVIYAAKGFQGKLLEDVVDVLMADGDRLLKVMIEEELGMSLENHPHPLQQALGAAIGSFLVAALMILASYLFGELGVIISGFICVGITAGIVSYYEKNRIPDGVLWNIGIASLAFGAIYFLIQYFLPII